MYVIKDLYIGNFKISQRFGENPSMYKKFGLSGHNGIDFRTPNGTPLVCCFDEAEVITAYDDKTGYGKHVKLWDKKQRLVAIYGHLQEIKVKAGEIVKYGQLLGLSNNTGYSTGPHLHFGVCEVDGNCIRQNRHNGYAGWLNPLDKTKFKWEISNISAPQTHDTPPPAMETLNDDERRALALLVAFKLSEEHGNLEGAMASAIGAYRELETLKKDISTYQSIISTAKKKLQEVINLLNS